MVKKRFSNIFLLSIIAISFLTLMVIFVTSRKNQVTIISQAQSNIPAKCNCTDPNICYSDGCSGKPKTPDNKLDSNRYDQVCKNINFGWPPDIEVQKYFCSIKQPDSCFDINKYKDDRYACFMERWFCHPSLCAGAGGKGDCGKYWHLPDGWTSYGCVQGPDNNHLTPVWGNLPPGLPGDQVTPTNTPRPAVVTPTPLPTRRPTIATPTKIPTPTMPNQVTAGTWPTRTIQIPSPTLQPSQETIPPVVIPTIPKQTSNSPLPTDIVLPPKVFVIPTFKINFSNKIKAIKESGAETVNASSKILDLPTAIFQQILNLDSLLKNKIDSLFRIYPERLH